MRLEYTTPVAVCQGVGFVDVKLKSERSGDVDVTTNSLACSKIPQVQSPETLQGAASAGSGPPGVVAAAVAASASVAYIMICASE